MNQQEKNRWKLKVKHVIRGMLYGYKSADFDETNTIFTEEEMKTLLLKACEEHDLKQSKVAMEFARILHGEQYRKGDVEKLKYISHPYTLACHAICMGIHDDDLIAACLLHDVVEDTLADIEDLPVNDNVKKAVDLVTKKPDNSVPKEEWERKYYDAMKDNPIACMVKVLDRCNNVSMMSTGFNYKKIIEYIGETEEFIEPLFDEIIRMKPEWKSAVWLVEYQMLSILESVKRFV
ncbi:MAG: hypothetical protein Q4B67_10015 [Eubacteriales bacterium]|nr:hypothetical protein [Eubacteriales bacterium]